MIFVEKPLEKYENYFAECGRRGGLKRARRLSPLQRSLIAARAAAARWGKKSTAVNMLSSVRLATPNMTDPAFLEELLSEESLKQWQQLYCKIADRPYGAETVALEKVLSATKIYGITPLWRGILRNIRGSKT